MSDNRQFVKELLEKQSKLSKRLQNLETWEGINAIVPVYKNIYITPAMMMLGVSPPSNAIRALGSAGGVYADSLLFDLAVQNDVYFEIGMPTDIDTGATVTLYVTWIPGIAWSAGNYVWSVEYLFYSANDSSGVGVPATSTVDVTPTDAVTIIESALDPGFIMGDKTRLFVHLFRDVASDNGDSTGDVLDVRMEYVANKLGTAV